MYRKSYNPRLLLLVAGLFIALAIVLIAIALNANKGKQAGLTPTMAPNPAFSVTVAPFSTGGAGDWGAWGGQAGGATGLATFMPTTRPTPLPTAAPTATPSNVFRSGDRGESVRYVQERLKALGYLSGSVDGVFGNATEAALKNFQSNNGLSADGVVGQRTMDKLKSSSAKKAKTSSSSGSSKSTSMPRPITYTPSEPTTYRYLQLGSSGKDVTKLQNRLRDLGYLGQKANGMFDDATEEAVRAFQSRNGQWVDGVAGQDTQSMLFSSRALPASQ
jgi:peptidoglycan hydrolase-like protein with peptidoglycan-binding domain